MPEMPKYWFPAKRYGWGWGLPTSWQGWLVMLVFSILLVGGFVVLLPRFGAGAFVAYAALLSALLMAVCWAKGERPRWRSGRK